MMILARGLHHLRFFTVSWLDSLERLLYTMVMLAHGLHLMANTCSYTYYTYNAYGYNQESTTMVYRYCSKGCCGSHPDYYCCYYPDYYSYYNADLTAGAVTGIVLGVFVSLAIIIGIIVCLVVMCRNSRLKQMRAHNTPGVIFQPQQTGAGVVTFMPGTTGQLNPYGMVYQPVTGMPQQTGMPSAGAVVPPSGGIVHRPPTAQATVPMSGIQPVNTALLPAAQVTSHVPQSTGMPVHGQTEKSNDSPPPMYNP